LSKLLCNSVKYTLEKTEGRPRMYNPETMGIQDVERWQTKRKNTTQKTKKMSNTDPSKNRGCTQVFAKGNKFLSLIILTPCHIVNTRWNSTQTNITNTNKMTFIWRRVAQNNVELLWNHFAETYFGILGNTMSKVYNRHV
jgi:hypothetical protein